MPSLPYKPKMTEIVSEESIAAGGEVITVDLPVDFTVTGLGIHEEALVLAGGAAPTLAQALTSITTFELTTRSGSPWKMSGSDLYYLNRDIYGKAPDISNKTLATATSIVFKSTMVPLNPMGILDTKMGVTPATKGKVRLTMGTNAAAVLDNRTVSITAYGYEGLQVPEFMGAFVDSFTSIVGDNFRDIQADRISGMMGAYAFATTSWEDLTTTNAPGIKKMGWAVSKSVREKTKAHILGLLNQDYELTLAIDAEVAPVENLVMLDVGLRHGNYIPYVDGLQVYIDSGVAEALRVHPLLAVRNE